MFRLRIVFLGATAALALGTASALAMTEALTGGDSDSHGDAVASAARNCPHGAGGVHGACVSSVARTHDDGQENENDNKPHETGQPQIVKDCKATVRTSDKHDHKGIGACVSAHTSHTSSDGSADESETESDAAGS